MSGILSIGNFSATSGLNSLGDASVNGRLFVGADASFGGKLFLAGDSSLNGNLSLASDLTVNGNMYVRAYTTRQMITELSYQLIIAQDLSVNGRLFLSNDASINSRLFVGADASFGNRVFVAGDASMNRRLYVGADASFTGNLFVSKILKPTTISEPFITNTGTTSPYTLDYSTGSTFYITTPPASNFTVNLTNVPADINRTYVATLIITTTTNKTYCNSIQINSAAAITPYYAGGVPLSLSSGSMITQSISIQRITVGDVAANVSLLTAVTAWY